jgi:hypothetical protein
MPTHFLEATLIGKSGQLKKANPSVVLRSAVIEGRARIRVPVEHATASLVLRVKLPPSLPIDIAYNARRPTHELNFDGRRVALQICTNGKQSLEVSSRARAAQVFEEALYSEFINLEGYKNIRHEYEKFFSLCFESVCVPADKAFLNDLALVLADVASENFKVNAMRRVGVTNLSTKARESLAYRLWKTADTHAEHNDYSEALLEAELKVLEEVWSRCTAASLVKQPEMQPRLERFRGTFKATFPEVVRQYRSSEDKELPTVRRLVLTHQFGQAVQTYLETLLYRRWLDVTRADHIRCNHCKAVFEAATLNDAPTARDGDWLATFSYRNIDYTVRRVWKDSKLLRDCPRCKTGQRGPGYRNDDIDAYEQESKALVNDIRREVVRALRERDPSTDPPESLILRVFCTGGARFAEALNLLPPRPSAAELRSCPDLVIPLVLPKSSRSAGSIAVRVGDACASYLEVHDSSSLKKAAQILVKALTK